MAEDSQNNEERERAILEGFLSGSEQGARAFLNEYLRFILRAIGAAGIKDNALTRDDLLGTCMELLLRDNKRAIRLFKMKSKFSSYLFTICRRHVIKIVSRPLPPAQDPDILELPSVLVEEFLEEEWLLLKRGIHLCTSNEQIFIKMMFNDGCDTREIMGFFGWTSESTVYSQKNKIIKKLKKIIKRLGNSDNK